MKKLISTILILCFCLGIYSCSKKDEVDLEESTSTDNSTTTDTTAPTVTSVSTTADNQSLVSLTDNITVTFSEAMDTTYVTTSTSDTNCAGTIRVSSDNFSNCVRMSSEPVSSNSNKTFTLDPNDNLTFGLTYLTRVTTGVKDTAGNALSSQYETTNGFTTAESISISSSASDNSSVGIGSTYLYQVDTGGTYSDSVTYSLSNAPDNMTISSSGLVTWTPDNASDIKTHDNITITLTTASGYVLTESYDLTVTGTCVSGNVLSIWSGDQRTSTDSTKFLGNIIAYTDNASDNCGNGNNLDCTAENNYQYHSPIASSENLNIGPTPSATKGNMFFYNQYDNTSNTYLFWMFGKGGAEFSPDVNSVHLDVFTASNTSSDNVTVSDDNTKTNAAAETYQESQSESSGLFASTYTGRYTYATEKSDGGVIGPFTGTAYRIFVDLGGKSSLNPTHVVKTSPDEAFLASGVSGNDLGLGNLDSFNFWSKDNSSFSLGAVDNFTVGYNTTITCEDLLPAPDNLSASGANNTITLTWNTVSGATGYTLYWDNVSGIDSSDTAITSITNDNYTHNNLDNGSTYYYKVAAVNSSGTGTLSSVASALLSANIQGSQTYNAHTYAMTSAAMTFAEAKAAAVAVGGYLTTVNTKAENTFLTNKFYAAYGNKALWIGANDIATEDTWVWDNGTTSGDSGLTDNICGTGCNPNSNATWADGTRKWNNNEPNDSGSNEDCANITNSSGFWNDLNCANNQYGIIEFD